jgi:uncharacterized protein YigE (DUF2233 family)
MRAVAGLVIASLIPVSSLSVWTGDRWEAWWHSTSAPARWNGPLPALANRMEWRPAGPGVEWSDLRLSGPGEAHRIRLIVAKIDPGQVRFRLDVAYRDHGRRPGWSLERASGRALVAINAGQFPRTTPWGWVVLDGRQRQPPGSGPLSVGVGFDSAGSLHWISPDSLSLFERGKGLAFGFQSYPRLLASGSVPPELRAEGSGIDRGHRDARAALGETRDGKVLLVITRYDGVGGLLDFVPFGLTVPEMAAVMGALGSENAVLLDGGISSQLLVREPRETHRWRGLRAVPMGLLVEAR